LALHLGHALRRDQIIVYRIRKKRYNNETEEIKKIFGKLYNPSGKCFCDFLPDFYNLFYWLFFSSEIFIHITTIIKICEIKNTVISFDEYEYILYPVMLIHVFFIILTLKIRRCYYNKYRQATKECPDMKE
jgi:hypothetical protein